MFAGGQQAMDGPSEVRALARLSMAVGVTRAMAGLAAWLVARSQLAAEKIVVQGSARWFPGRRVRGPLTAYAEADFIQRSALSATGGRTYGQIEEGDPLAKVAMDASLLRSSLYTSVMAFAAAASEVATGGMLVAIGAALGRLDHPTVRT